MPKGLKTGGRKKGTPNRKSLELQNKLRKLDFDPTIELVAELRKPLIPEPDNKGVLDCFSKDKAKILMDLHDFIYAKRKSVEEPGENGQGAIDVTPKDESDELSNEELTEIARLKSHP
jgi:hypothetical protein